MILDFNGIEGIPGIKKKLIYQKFPKLAELISDGKFEKSWLLELGDNEFNQFIKSKSYEYFTIEGDHFRLHPYLRVAGNAINADLIIELCKFGLKSKKSDIGIALDPLWFPSGEIVETYALERGYGVFYDLTTIIKKVLRDHQVVSVFYNPSPPSLEDYDKESLSIEKKIEILEKNLNRHTRFPLRIVMNLIGTNMINFNIYEFRYPYRKDFVINYSIHAIYDIDKNFFTHLDGKALLFEVENYNPDSLVWFKGLPRKKKRILFRLDGEIENKYFVGLTTIFFYQNDLIFEFFELDSLEQNIIEYLEK